MYQCGLGEYHGHRSHQSWWMYRIVPEHLHGWKSGWSGSAGALQIRQVSWSVSASATDFTKESYPCSVFGPASVILSNSCWGQLCQGYLENRLNVTYVLRRVRGNASDKTRAEESVVVVQRRVHGAALTTFVWLMWSSAANDKSPNNNYIIY